MIPGSNEQLQQHLEYTLLKSDCHSWWISKETLEERYAIKFCFKLGKNDATETYGMLQTAFRPSCMNRASVFLPGQCTSPQLVTDYLTKMGIKTFPHPSYSPDIAPCDFCLFPKLRGCRYETIEERKRLWLRSSTRSHKRTSIGPSRSCWNGTKSALQPEEVTSKRSWVSCVYYHVCTINKSTHTKKVWKLI